MEEPIKCPFCGKLGSVFAEQDEDGWWFVICEIMDNGCGGAGPACIDKDEAIRKWNRRSV